MISVLDQNQTCLEVAALSRGLLLSQIIPSDSANNIKGVSHSQYARFFYQHRSRVTFPCVDSFRGLPLPPKRPAGAKRVISIEIFLALDRP